MRAKLVGWIFVEAFAFGIALTYVGHTVLDSVILFLTILLVALSAWAIDK